eukprot:CAMPEP_0185771888 /NCGR_PEP_ID=MMETSP1174-20130828/65731_1 /TAXON_ID=35687 /ORGANISM="Dictyocha speculum, Strain CCMP1381" /LENGTH=435 /DNA_ID=CAMNT_0028457899 /DNA_START=8 /DNA_END=1315 /DNA_ORIENTATION=+
MKKSQGNLKNAHWIAIAAAGGIAVGSLITACIIPRHPSPPRSRNDESQGQDLPLDIEDEVLSRNESFFGADGLGAVKSSFVIVVGSGGVGSHAAAMLARSGVKKLRVIDFDQVTLSSLNRHAVASLRDVGRPKVEVLKRSLNDIAPWCAVDAHAVMFREETAEELLAPWEENGQIPDYLVDSIDDVNSKVALLAKCQALGIRVISAMAAGAKADPTRLHMGSLTDASRDPLASKMRWALKKVNVNCEAIQVVYSSEQPRVTLQPLTEEQRANPADFGVVDHMRTRVMPVLGTSPGIMGQSIAAHVLCTLAGKPFNPQAVPSLSHKATTKMLQKFQRREKRVYEEEKFLFDHEDVDFIVSTMWRSKTSDTLERMERSSHVEITRWRREKGPVLNNYVLLRSEECAKLEEQGVSFFSEDVVRRIDAHLASFGLYDSL